MIKNLMIFECVKRRISEFSFIDQESSDMINAVIFKGIGSKTGFMRSHTQICRIFVVSEVRPKIPVIIAFILCIFSDLSARTIVKELSAIGYY
jgi:hypothetical protein